MIHLFHVVCVYESFLTDLQLYQAEKNPQLMKSHTLTTPLKTSSISQP